MTQPRVVLTVLVGASLLLTGFLIIDFWSYESARDKRSVELGREAGIRVAAALDAELLRISARARDFAAEVADIDDEAALLERIRKESPALPLLLGVTVAYEPGRFLGRDRFAPFFNSSRNEFQFVALIMFIVLYVSTREDDNRSGMTTMNVIQSLAGLLFILLLAHVNERNRIQTPEIAYIELFYFSMYVLITLQSVMLAALFRGAKWKIFEYHDNLALKLLFWPMLLSIWYAVTLFRFY